MINPVDAPAQPSAPYSVQTSAVGDERVQPATTTHAGSAITAAEVASDPFMQAIETQIGMVTLLFVNREMSRSRSELEERLQKTRTQED